MTEHENIADEAMRQIHSDAISNAILYGFGLVRIGYVNGHLEFSCVDIEEYRDLADELIWVDNNAVKETKQ